MDGADVTALHAVNLRIDEGEFVAIAGPSGSGKSTLLHLLGCLDHPTSGFLRVSGREVASLSESELAGLRNARFGFVFQSFRLLERASARENVALPLVYRGVPRGERRRRAAEALALVGLEHRLGHRPDRLSGGERQRVAIARALVGDPGVVLADEPTGSLDADAGRRVLDLLERLNAERGVAVVLVTHDPGVAGRARRRVRIRDGRIEHDDAAGRDAGVPRERR
ncbi:ABC transporter ATP-binding protein [Actinomadura graeca]|uniref:ABC transporter ATP-binding protein n=2 Tax=Actinomadura graeca TaxID=2750812 RepID=A0ABX8R8Q8_9ACTN|nr:ABC transporter ATP-binding protein [Actinomadura graeca]